MRCIDADALMGLLKAWQYEAQRLGAEINNRFATAIIAQVNAMPTIEPERKKGEWLMDGEKCGELMWRCSECRVSEAVPTATSFVSGIVYPQWKYCPNCGVNMMEEGDHE